MNNFYYREPIDKAWKFPLIKDIFLKIPLAELYPLQPTNYRIAFFWHYSAFLWKQSHDFILLILSYGGGATKLAPSPSFSCLFLLTPPLINFKTFNETTHIIFSSYSHFKKQTKKRGTFAEKKQALLVCLSTVKNYQTHKQWGITTKIRIMLPQSTFQKDMSVWKHATLVYCTR